MKHYEVVAGIIMNNDEILCMKRPVGKYEYTSLKYEFPGGKIEPGETKVEALKRELMEEMDMKVITDDSNFFMTVNHEYPDFDITMHSFLCTVEDRNFNMKEHTNFKWLKKEELTTLDWAAADVPIMKKIIEG